MTEHLKSPLYRPASLPFTILSPESSEKVLKVALKHSGISLNKKSPGSTQFNFNRPLSNI